MRERGELGQLFKAWACHGRSVILQAAKMKSSGMGFETESRALSTDWQSVLPGIDEKGEYLKIVSLCGLGHYYTSVEFCSLFPVSFHISVYSFHVFYSVKLFTIIIRNFKAHNIAGSSVYPNRRGLLRIDYGHSEMATRLHAYIERCISFARATDGSIRWTLLQM